MAVLVDGRRAELWAELMADLSSGRESTGSLTKADIRAAVNGIDDFLNGNASSINTAIPQPARGVLSVAQKAKLLMFVVRYRYLDGA